MKIVVKAEGFSRPIVVLLLLFIHHCDTKSPKYCLRDIFRVSLLPPPLIHLLQILDIKS